MRNLIVLLIAILLGSCSKDPKQFPTAAQLDLPICDMPLVPVDGLTNTLSSTSYEIEQQPVVNYLTPVGLIYLEFKSKRISTPYWNGGVPFTTKQVITDTNMMKYLTYLANVRYGSWRVRFVRDSVEFENFTGYRDTINVVSNMVRSDGATADNILRSGVSGIAYIGGLYNNQINDGFVFANIFPNTRYKKIDMGSIVIHEAGHMVGLYHQSEYDANCVKVQEYRLGTFMGNPFYPNLGKWSIGPTPFGCNSIQNDTAVLTSKLGLRYIP